MSFTLGWPQIIWLLLTAYGVVLSILRHEQPCSGKHNAYLDLSVSILGASLLYWGGFFSQTQ